MVEKFETDPISFTFLSKNDGGFRMKISHFGNNKAVLIKSKKQKYFPIDASTVLSTQKALESVLNGNGKWLSYSALDFKT